MNNMVTLEGVDPRMIANNLTPFCLVHPGGVMKDQLEDLEISTEEAAEKMGVDKRMLEDVLNEKRPVTSELALMFEALIGVPSEDLIRLQADYDMESARRNKSFMEKLEKIRRIAAVL